MVRRVKQDTPPRRSYDSSSRRRRAEATRAAVIDAARVAFLDHGYAATSIPMIATAAGVSPELVYKSIGAKPAVLKAVFDTSVTGDSEPVALQQRPSILAMKAMTDAAQLLATYAELAVSVMTRLSPIYSLARDAAANDPAAGTVVEQMNSERLTGMTALAAQLTSLGQLKPELTPHEVRDILWTYNSPELFELLVHKRRWAGERYTRFLRDALINALLQR